MFASKVRDSSIRIEKNASRCKNFENMLCSNTSVHAVNKFGRSTSSFRKIFWIIILLICFVGCLLQVIEFISFYLKYSVVINLETKKAEFLEFPAVTLCNINSVRKQFQSCVERKLSYEECLNLENKVKISDSEKNTFIPLCNEKTKHDFTDVKRTWLNLITLDKFSRIKYGHQAEDFIKSCIFNEKLCSPADFKISLSNSYGNCFTFIASKTNMGTLFPGPASGLELEIDLEVFQYATFTDAVGAKLQLHDPRARHSIDEQSVAISPGTKTYVAVTKTIISRLPPPYKDQCKDYGVYDSRNNCVDDCLYNIISTKCFCSLRSVQNNSVPQCDIRDPMVFCCLFENYADKNCDCPLPCEENTFNTQVSSAVWPVKLDHNHNIIDCVSTNESNYISMCKRMRETRLILKIFWNTYEYTVYKQNPTFQKSEVLSQTGGLLSLWLGVSVIAVFEVLENLILLFISI